MSNVDYKEDIKASPSLEKDAYVPALESGRYVDSDKNELDQKSDEHLNLVMKSRHIAMISIGGVIGTGLFLGTAGSLSNGGPVGLWLGYCIMGSVCYAMMQCLGEFLSYLPVPGGHIKLAGRFVSPAMSFSMGYNYLFNWLIVLPAELSAAAVLCSYWSDASSAIFITAALVVVVLINLLGARAYAETEFVFCSIKVLTITGLIVLSFLLDVGATGDQGRLGFRYWKDPGPFVQYNGISGSLGQFLGFWSVLINAGFSFIGTEIISMTCGESRNPRKSVPSAIRKVFYRILIFYILGTLAISVITPSNAPNLSLKSHTAAKSPFVIAIQAAGIKGLPSVINACLLTSAVSAASSDMYTSSRALYGLAISGQAPRFFAKTTSWGLPYFALIVSFAFSCLAYMSVGSSSGTVFGYFANLTSVAGLTTWLVIGITHLRFRKGMTAQGHTTAMLPYRSIGGTFFSWYTIATTSMIILFSGWSVFLKGNWSASDFVSNYFPVPFFFVLYAGGSYLYGGKFVKPEEMDFITGLQQIIDNEVEEPKPNNVWEKFWSWIS
jgi:amino acid transporter